MDEKTIFEKLLNKEIPCTPIYEDEYTFAFHDINPQAPIHVLIIPKKKIININYMEESDSYIVGRICFAAKQIAKILNIKNSAYRMVFNNEAQAGQSVFYMHGHLLAGRDLSWPPG